MTVYHRIKLAAAATGIDGCGQENDKGDHYPTHKSKTKKYEAMYHVLHGAETPLDPALAKKCKDLFGLGGLIVACTYISCMYRYVYVHR